MSSIVLVPLTEAAIRVAVSAFPDIFIPQVPLAPPPVKVGEKELKLLQFKNLTQPLNEFAVIFLLYIS